LEKKVRGTMGNSLLPEEERECSQQWDW